MYSSASLKFNLLQSNRNVKAFENLVFLCSIHVCMCSVILVPSLQNSMHPVMKCPHWSFFFAPVSVTPLFPSSHSVSMSLPFSSHTRAYIYLCFIISAFCFWLFFRIFHFLCSALVTIFFHFWLESKNRRLPVNVCLRLYLPIIDLNLHYFWKWSAFEDYLLFCFGFTVVCAVITLLLLDSVVFVETLGSLAVMFEAMLGVPQLLQNFHNRSTKGMRYSVLQGQTELCSLPSHWHTEAQSDFTLVRESQQWFIFSWTHYANKVIYSYWSLREKKMESHMHLNFTNEIIF